MHPSHRPATGQQQRVRHYASNADSYSLFNLLTGPELFDRVEALLPEHRERLFPPTETLSMFLSQALSADGSCQAVVNDAMVKRVIGGAQAWQYGYRWVLQGALASAAVNDLGDQGVRVFESRSNQGVEYLKSWVSDFQVLHPLVSDSLGRTMTLTFNTAKRLTGLTAGSRQMTYTYSTAGRVTKATRTQGGQSLSRTYHYEDTREGGWLTGITDERNIRYVTWAYDAQGRVIRNELNGVQSKYLFTYNSNVSTTVTSPLGKQSTYTFQTIAGAKRITALAGAASPNCPNSNSSFTYDDRGLLKTKTDNKGNLTTYDYNERGLEISRTEAAGTPQARTITTEWHPSLFMPVTVSEPDHITQYTYDTQGRQLSQTVTQR